jgi:transcriptional regulator with XRE-family HTH domain
MYALYMSLSTIDTHIGARVRDLRSQRNLTLDTLANQANVSRAMLSRIERGESSPTAQLLNKVCGGLGITLSTLFAETQTPDTQTPGSPLSRRAAQATWRDPATNYLRRTISPQGTGSPVDITEIEFPPTPPSASTASASPTRTSTSGSSTARSTSNSATTSTTSKPATA